VNSDVLLEQVYLNTLQPQLNANHTETQSQNVPAGAQVPADYRDEQQEHAGKQIAAKKQRSGTLIKLDKFDLDKSEVMVHGFGVVTLGYLKKNVSDKFLDLAKRVLNNEPIFVHNRIREKHGFLMHAIKALVEIEKDIERMRRAGKMPGMMRRYNFNA